MKVLKGTYQTSEGRTFEVGKYIDRPKDHKIPVMGAGGVDDGTFHQLPEDEDQYFIHIKIDETDETVLGFSLSEEAFVNLAELMAAMVNANPHLLTKEFKKDNEYID